MMERARFTLARHIAPAIALGCGTWAKAPPEPATADVVASIVLPARPPDRFGVSLECVLTFTPRSVHAEMILANDGAEEIQTLEDNHARSNILPVRSSDDIYLNRVDFHSFPLPSGPAPSLYRVIRPGERAVLNGGVMVESVDGVARMDGWRLDVTDGRPFGCSTPYWVNPLAPGSEAAYNVRSTTINLRFRPRVLPAPSGAE